MKQPLANVPAFENNIRWLAVKNTDTQPAPPFGVMGITGVDNLGNITVARPTNDGQTTIIINGPFTIPAGEMGQGQTTWPAIVAYQTNPKTNDPPATGELWGAQDGEWTLGYGFSGFFVVGGSASGLTNVVPSGLVPGVVEISGGDSDVILATAYYPDVELYAYLLDVSVVPLADGPYTWTIVLPSADIWPGWYIDVRLANGDVLAGDTQVSLGIYDPDYLYTIELCDQVVRFLWTGTAWDIRDWGAAPQVPRGFTTPGTSNVPDLADQACVTFPAVLYPGLAQESDVSGSYAVSMMTGSNYWASGQSYSGADTWATCGYGSVASDTRLWSMQATAYDDRDGICGNPQSVAVFSWMNEQFNARYIQLVAGDTTGLTGGPIDLSGGSYIVVDGLSGITGTDSAGNVFRGGICVEFGTISSLVPPVLGVCDGGGSGSGSGSGSYCPVGTCDPGDDCSQGNCGSAGVPGTLTATVTSATGCLASLPSVIHYACNDNSGSGVHNYFATSPVSACGNISGGVANGTAILWTRSPNHPIWVLINATQFNTFAQTGYTCNPFSAVFLVDDGKGNSATVTVVSP